MDIKVTDLTDFISIEDRGCKTYLYREGSDENPNIKTTSVVFKNPPCPSKDTENFIIVVKRLVEILSKKMPGSFESADLVYYKTNLDIEPNPYSPYLVLYVEDEKRGNHVEVVTTFGKFSDLVEIR